MTELVEYTSTKAVEGLQPSDLGVSGYEQMGRHIGLTARQLGSTVKTDIDEFTAHKAQQEISDDTTNAANAYAGAANDLDKYMSKPEAASNPNAASDWINNNLTKFLDPIGKDADTDAGKAHARELRDNLLMSFTRTAHGYQSTVAGQHLQDNLTETANVLGQMVHDHPEMLDGAVKALGIGLNNQIDAGTFSPDYVAKLRSDFSGPLIKQLAIAAVQGAAEVNAPQASIDLHSGRFGKYFNGEDMQKLDNFIKAQGNNNDELVRKQNKDAFDADVAKLQNSIPVDPATGAVTIPRTFFSDVAKISQTYAGKPGAAEGAATITRTLTDWAQAQIKRKSEGTPVVTDPHVFQDFRDRITLSADDPRAVSDEQLIQANLAGTLSDKDFARFRGDLALMQKDPAYKVALGQYKEFIKEMAPSIVKGDIYQGNNDPIGHQNLLQMEQNFTDQFERAYRKNDGSWKDLLDRSKPGSFWQQSVRYQTGPAAGQENLQRSVTGTVGLAPNIPAAQPHKPGQSPEDYLKGK